MNIEIIQSIIGSWPLAFVVVTVIFVKDLKKLIKKITIFTISVAGTEITLDTSDINRTASSLLIAMYNALKDEQLQIFFKILSTTQKGKKAIVGQVFGKELKRDENNKPVGEESEKILTTLRALRGFGLIRPVEGKRARWNNDSEIIVTSFGKFVSEHEQLKQLLEQK